MLAAAGLAVAADVSLDVNIGPNTARIWLMPPAKGGGCVGAIARRDPEDPV